MSNRLFVTTSWDDGVKSDLGVIRLLNKYGMKGTFYITRDYWDNPLEKDDIIEVSKSHEIGAHTLSHSILPGVSLLKAKEEIEGSKHYLEDVIGDRVYMFCYPYGKYNETIKNVVRDSGFIAARTCVCGSFNAIEDPYEWQTTMCVSNGSPLMNLKIWLKTGISIKSMVDWTIRAKLLFDLALVKGGVYHLWGHSFEIAEGGEWDKLDKVFSYISNREGVRYLTNREVFRYYL